MTHRLQQILRRKPQHRRNPVREHADYPHIAFLSLIFVEKDTFLSLTFVLRQGNTLLFFDEIQACPNCIRGLRFFKEKLPGLHVIAAGSLLEFVLKDVCSFGVGRITSFFMAPMTFCEFVEAVEGESLSEILAGLQFDKPPDEPFHRRFLELMRVYLMTE